MLKEKIKIKIFAFSSFGKGLSGGDNIFIEIAKRWATYGSSISVHLFKDGYEICKRSGLNNVKYHICKRSVNTNFFPMFFLFRTFYGVIEALKEKRKTEEKIFIYSASDFWPDTIPAFLYSRIHKKSTWIAGFYMFAPSPVKRDYPYKGLNILRGVLYYLTQLPILFLVKRYADFVFVTSELDIAKFLTEKRNQNRVIVVKGGVDLDLIDSVPPQSRKEFDAVFMGRFHPQKGVKELIEIWSRVIKNLPNAKLALIGDGYLKEEITGQISRLGLEKNVTLFGYKFGKEKIEILKKSKIVVHPATYDSGGMASSEAMACGLPGVSFDLESLKTYYPKGMLKTACFSREIFAHNVIRLLTDKELYSKMSQEAREYVNAEWGWSKKADLIFNKITKS
ncbi:MAG: glycosyltransferase family 4 protein [Candidatus Omnitrophota bacterium]|nr:glycosyltransferase family 4 protein [Candidatus Omnitrophota bacterium]